MSALIALGMALPAFAQFDVPRPVTGTGNVALRNLAVGSAIESLGSFGGAEWERWSSSNLKAEGASPTPPPVTGDADVDEETGYEYGVRLDDWGCMYTARSLVDGRPDTCWVEGAKGDGEGETVIAMVDANKPVWIRNGFQKNDKTFDKNNRVRKAKVFLLRADRQLANQYDTGYADIKVLAVCDVELSDVMGWQALKLPDFKLSPRKPKDADDWGFSDQTFIAIKIVSVYSGSAYRDTCISDISNEKN